MDDMSQDSAVTHHRFSTTDPDTVEEFVRGAYIENTLVLNGDRHSFTFDHWSVDGPGFAIDRLRATIGMAFDAESASGHPFLVNAPTRGHIRYSGNVGFDDARADVGTAVLVPPIGGLDVYCDNVDEVVVALGREEVAAHVTAMTGLAPSQLVFESNIPVDDAMNRHWAATVAFVRDDVLADPWAATQPIVVAQAFQSLAAALLSTFPNTALARANDPEGRAVRGDAPEHILREVVDYLDAHADHAVGPADIATIADMPADQVVEGFRRRHDRSPAEHLWAARLRGVRRDLLDTTEATTSTVARLAAKWGFTHVPRFRITYMRAFDEWPEDTLNR